MDKPQVFICSDCGKPIRDGDIYLDVMGEQFCAKCALMHYKFAKKIEENNN